MTHCLIQEIERCKNNPLLARLPEKLSAVDMGNFIQTNIFAGAPLKGISYPDRSQMIHKVKSIFVATSFAVRIAVGLQNLLHVGLQSRDPRLAENKRRITQMAQEKGNPMGKVIWFPEYAGGMTIRGITGLGKSQTTERFLTLLGPQVIEHGLNEEAGWEKFTQLVYLKVPMPADAHRGGFLYAILREMDLVMGTDYHSRLSGRSWTIEKLLVEVLHLMALHRCGLFIVEESQEGNMKTKTLGRDFAMFFLRCLNWGIPTVLIGNPNAFANIDCHSQDLSRFSEAGNFHLDPILDPSDPNWKRLVDGVWFGACLTDESDEPYEPTDLIKDKDIYIFLWRLTGGFPRFLARLREVTLDIAIRRQAKRVALEHIVAASISPEMLGVADLIEGFATQNVELIRGFKDIPVERYKQLWAAASKAKGKGLQSSDAASPPATEPLTPKGGSAATVSAKKGGKSVPKAKRAASPPRASNKKGNPSSLTLAAAFNALNDSTGNLTDGS